MENNCQMVLRKRLSAEERAKQKEEAELLKENKPILDERPFIEYNGKVKYFTTQIDCAVWCDTLLNQAIQTEDLFIMGFDIEWPFSFQTGSGKTAVIQISPSLNECFIFHVSTLKNLPKSLTELLAYEKVRLTGVNIKNDIRKLSRDFSGIDVEKVITNCIDVGILANNIHNPGARWSMERLVNHFFDLRINKNKKVRQSKWHIMPLSQEQLTYAAIDAYASLKLYHHLKQMQSNILEKENNSSIGQAVLKWVDVVRNKNAILSGSLVKEEQALKFAQYLEHVNCQARNGWLGKLKKGTILLKNLLLEKARMLMKEIEMIGGIKH
ncbi:3prime-5prime exonuclease [Popillia japonica]|uniref:3'-5' exonuclease n=1 Tax=Popillia japonica TaxID=7064 RepID=A0AAW1NCQ8_POPJA